MRHDHFRDISLFCLLSFVWPFYLSDVLWFVREHPKIPWIRSALESLALQMGVDPFQFNHNHNHNP